MNILEFLGYSIAKELVGAQKNLIHDENPGTVTGIYSKG